MNYVKQIIIAGLIVATLVGGAVAWTSLNGQTQAATTQTIVDTGATSQNTVSQPSTGVS